MQPINALLGTTLTSHMFTTPETALRKGVGYTGANFRLRRVVQELLHSTRGGYQAKPIKIVVLGGSIR